MTLAFVTPPAELSVSGVHPAFNGLLQLLSDSLDDIEGLRKATQNRLRSLTRDTADSDGEVRGLGLTTADPTVARVQSMLADMIAVEKEAIKELEKEVTKSPLYPWIQREKGIGKKQAARLIAVIGDPYWNTLHNRPRTVSELWAYSGYSVIEGAAQRRKKGVQSNWNTSAKSRAFLMALSCTKTTGRYREVYDEARERYADSLHVTECVRCGPSGKPALPGSELSAGHQYARALRVVSKEILRDLWIEAKKAHEAL